MSISRSDFGTTPDGRKVSLYTCRNQAGTSMKVTDYGAIVVSFMAPDRTGKSAELTLGFPSLDGYLVRHPYFGSTVGRFCNRIAAGRFVLDDVEYTLAKNDGPNHLHGGLAGFDKVVWDAREINTDDSIGVKFSCLSRDGEEGYPGNLNVTAEYSINAAGDLKMRFLATTDKATVLNLTNHNYWNLAGAGSGTILDHELMIPGDQYVVLGSGLIPTGEIAPVAGTPLDFTSLRRIGDRIGEIKTDPVGYDNCFVLEHEPGTQVLAARVKDPSSGRIMEVYTTQPAVQLYTGNFLNGSDSNGGFNQYGGLCLETQHYPDAPNHPNFPSTVLRPGEVFDHTTVHRFLVE